MNNVLPFALEELPRPHHANAICLGFYRGTSVQELAFRHGCTPRMVEDVLAGRRYGHITGRGPLDPTLAKDRPSAHEG